MTGISELLGECIRELRQAKGLTQEQLAAAAEISIDYVSDIERGRYNITLTVLVRVAKALGTKPSVIVEHMERRAGK